MFYYLPEVQMDAQMFVKPNYGISNPKNLQHKLRYVNKIKERELSVSQEEKKVQKSTYHERQG